MKKVFAKALAFAMAVCCLTASASASTAGAQAATVRTGGEVLWSNNGDEVCGPGLPVGASARTASAYHRKGPAAYPCAGRSEAGTEAGAGSFLGRYEPVKIACPGDLKRNVGQAIIIAKNREKIY